MNDKTQKNIGNWLNRQGNPMRFLNFADKLLPWVAIMTCILFGIGLYFSFFASPADYQQGETVRIMYIHVPAAWLAMQTYISVSYTHLTLPTKRIV